MSTTTTRTDIHRPAEIQPDDYGFLGVFYQGDKAGYLRAYSAANAKHDGYLRYADLWQGNHAEKGSCDICGARFHHGAYFSHVPSGQVIHTGQDCAEKMNLGTEAMRKARAEIDRANNTPDPARASVVPVSPKQAKFLESLLAERGEAGRLALEGAGGMESLSGGRGGTASTLIDTLLSMPKSSGQQAPAGLNGAVRPTPEQQQAIDLFLAGESFKVHAFAGTGKTTVLKMMAEAAPHRNGRFLAFNRNIIEDAKSKMPRNLVCSTAHSLAWASTPDVFRTRCTKARRMSSNETALRLGLSPIQVSFVVEGQTFTKTLAPAFLASLVMGAVERFCQSADTEPAEAHFRYVDGIDPADAAGKRTYENNNRLRRGLVGKARAAWQDLCDPNGVYTFRHSHYLKQFELSSPKLNVDFVMVDEAQDLSPVLMSIVEQQTHCQIVLVGDSFQAINGFTGAVDALERTSIDKATFLTKSFRFGPAIADEANKILVRLDAPNRIEGNGAVRSTVGVLASPTCFLARTNATAVRRVLEEIEVGGRPHLVGGGEQVVSFAEAALALQAGVPTSHPELACFASWPEVQAYVANDEQGSDLRLMVKLIDEFTAQAIIDALRSMPTEAQATLVCSTAHKVKGREWDTVKLAGDFPQGKDGQEPSIEDLRLLYVAATRAKITVDISQVGCLNQRPQPVAEAS